VIRNNKIFVNDAPKEIYNNPKNKYVAALFDDVNEITINNKEYLLYPHQLKIIEKSNLKAVVLNSYFKGSFWLIKAEFENQIIFIKHPHFLEKKAEIYLAFLKKEIT
jgi:ABC-type proline/glycine betaine transport system ATPase subunit